MLNIRSYSGGFAQTNGYLFDAPGGAVLVDAPEGIAGWLRAEGVGVRALLLTHGHYDHVIDAARVREEHGSEVIAHQAVTGDLTLASLMAEFGMPVEIRPFPVDRELGGAREFSCLGLGIGVRHVPGHSPDSICYVVADPDDERAVANVFGGDVLFRGGIGRTDFPNGDHELLIAGIRRELLSLDDATRIFPGHGPATTVGAERVHFGC